MPQDIDEILTVSEIAQRLRVPKSWVYGHAPLLGAYRLGKYLRFSWNRTLQHLEASSEKRLVEGAAATSVPKPLKFNLSGGSWENKRTKTT